MESIKTTLEGIKVKQTNKMFRNKKSQISNSAVSASSARRFIVYTTEYIIFFFKNTYFKTTYRRCNDIALYLIVDTYI